MKTKRRYRFKAKPDITAAELAELIPGFFPGIDMTTWWTRISEGAKRHIILEDVEVLPWWKFW